MSSHPPPPDRRRGPGFRPRATLALFYVALFFFLFAFLAILPELLEVLRGLPPGPEQEQAAAEAARRASRPLLSLVLALVTTGLGTHFHVLPGMR